MDTPVLITPSPDRPLPACSTPVTLPRWEELPAARQRELVLTLATMLLKRLPAPRLTAAEVRHE